MKRKEYLLLIPVFLFLVLTGCIGLNPLEKGSLQGTVNGGDGPLPGVKVEVGEMVALTDVSGHFLLENVPAGDQYVFFSGSGYASAFQKVTIIKDGRVSLSPEGTISLLPGTDENVRNSIFSLYQYGFYERSKEESDSFLTRFPTSSFYSDVLFIKGASFFYLGEYADSIPFLSSLVNGYPESFFADDGQYLLAKSYGQGQSRWGDAITAYRKLVDNYPQSEFVGPSYAEMGDCYYIMESYQDAKVVYELARPFGGDVERKSIYGLAHCYYKSELYYKSATLFAEYVTRYPDNDLADDAQYFEGASRYRREDYQDALTAFEKSISYYPNGTWYNGILIVPASMFNKGLCLEKLGRSLEAYETYNDIIRKYPGAQWADGTSLINSAQFRIDLLKDTVL